jgi:hypothetical protein
VLDNKLLDTVNKQDSFFSCELALLHNLRK